MLGGLPLVVRVAKAAESSKLISDIYIATDDERIVAVCESFSANVLLTSKDHESGTDRSDCRGGTGDGGVDRCFYIRQGEMKCDYWFF